MSALLDHMDHAGVQERGLGVAYNLSNNSEDRCEAFVKLGLVKLAIDAMNRHKAHRGVQEEGCSALYVLMQVRSVRLSFCLLVIGFRRVEGGARKAARQADFRRTGRNDGRTKEKNLLTSIIHFSLFLPFFFLF